jgi:hypothetical protein
MSHIDYARAKREGPKLKAALTRAINSGEPLKVEAACRAAVTAWDAWGAWPDNWHRWNIALGDAAHAQRMAADPFASSPLTIPDHLEEL